MDFFHETIDDAVPRRRITGMRDGGTALPADGGGTLALALATATAVDVDRSVEALLPEGLEPPADLPTPVFQAALITYLEGRRLDMCALAEEVGISRATLYRKAGSRDRLLGEVAWYLTRRLLADAAKRTQNLTGADRVVAFVADYLGAVSIQQSLRTLLEREPECALRVLTARQGPVQKNLVAAIERLLATEEAAGLLRPRPDSPTLAFLLVRIGESFLYADAIGHGRPDVDGALTVVRRLLED